ncbi:chitobiase/beta-hexosaminidase C-terminal domain-containing protein [Coprobacter sp.]
MKKSTFFKSLLVTALVFFGSKSFAENYVQITSIDDLTTGSYVVVGGTSSNAMSTTQAGTSAKPYMAYEAVTIEGDKITNPAASVIWTITKESDNTFSISSNGKYVSSKGAGNYAQLIDAIANTAKYNVTISNGEFKFACVDPSGRHLQYNANKSQERFACYTGTQKDLLLFKLEVTEEGTTATPSITPLTGTYYTEQEVSIECETAGATIYYTTNGTDPTTESTPYTTSFKVSTTTTIKAIAVGNGLKASDIKEVTLTFPVATEVANIAEFMSTATAGDAVYKITGPVTVVYQNGTNLYIQDASGSLLVFGNDGIEDYNEGDVITGLMGKYGVYQNITQMVPVYAPAAVSGTPVEPVTMAIADITAADVYKYIKLSEAVFKENATFNTKSTTNGIVVSGDKEMTIRNSFRVIDGTFEASKKWDIVGFVSVFGGTPQIYPISITESQLDGVKAATTESDVIIYSSNGKIFINAVGGEKIELFSITGQKVAEKVAVSGINVLDAICDITLVKVGSKVVKVIK